LLEITLLSKKAAVVPATVVFIFQAIILILYFGIQSKSLCLDISLTEYYVKINNL